MKEAIGYLRVSTSEQGRSGVGLAAQRRDIETFGAREEFTVRSWHQDIQTGAGRMRCSCARTCDGAEDRRAAPLSGNCLSLDRLSRNVHFITGLWSTRCIHRRSIGKGLRRFYTAHLCILAEQERKLIRNGARPRRPS